MIIVCLDQCAISQLAKASATTRDADLRKLLVAAAGEPKLICPVAPETLAETTGLHSTGSRLAVYELQCELAEARLGGPIWAFKGMWKLIKEETLALARSQPPPSAFELINWHSVEDDQLAAETWSGMVDAKQRMTERVRAAVNLENTPATFKETSHGIILEHASHVWRQVQRLIAGEEPLEKDHMGFEVARFLQQQRLGRAELEKLSEDIRYHRWQAIPVIFNRTQLAAQLEAEARSPKHARAYDPNDELDIPRVAVGLSAADLVITDAAMAHLCKRVKTDRWSRAKVFAVGDTPKIIEHLKSVLSTKGEQSDSPSGDIR